MHDKEQGCDNAKGARLHCRVYVALAKCLM